MSSAGILQDQIDLRQLQDERLSEIQDTIAAEQPLIAPPTPVHTLLHRYTDHSTYQHKLQQIAAKYKQVRKVRADGSCFYRAYMFGVFVAACADKQTCQSLIDIIEPSMAAMCDNPVVGLSQFTVEDFYDVVMEQLHHIRDNNADEQWCEQMFNDSAISECITYYARLLVCCQIKTHAEHWQPFTEDDLTVEQYVDTQVLRVSADADHLTIQALTSVLNVCCRIEYLDQSAQGQLNHHTFPDTATDTASTATVLLLYTLNHYDLLQQ